MAKIRSKVWKIGAGENGTPGLVVLNGDLTTSQIEEGVADDEKIHVIQRNSPVVSSSLLELTKDLIYNDTLLADAKDASAEIISEGVFDISLSSLTTEEDAILEELIVQRNRGWLDEEGVSYTEDEIAEKVRRLDFLFSRKYKCTFDILVTEPTTEPLVDADEYPITITVGPGKIKILEEDTDSIYFVRNEHIGSIIDPLTDPAEGVFYVPKISVTGNTRETYYRRDLIEVVFRDALYPSSIPYLRYVPGAETIKLPAKHTLQSKVLTTDFGSYPLYSILYKKFEDGMTEWIQNERVFDWAGIRALTLFEQATPYIRDSGVYSVNSHDDIRLKNLTGEILSPEFGESQTPEQPMDGPGIPIATPFLPDGAWSGVLDYADITYNQVPNDLDAINDDEASAFTFPFIIAEKYNDYITYDTVELRELNLGFDTDYNGTEGVEAHIFTMPYYCTENNAMLLNVSTHEYLYNNDTHALEYSQFTVNISLNSLIQTTFDGVTFTSMENGPQIGDVVLIASGKGEAQFASIVSRSTSLTAPFTIITKPFTATPDNTCTIIIFRAANESQVGTRLSTIIDGLSQDEIDDYTAQYPYSNYTGESVLPWISNTGWTYALGTQLTTAAATPAYQLFTAGAKPGGIVTFPFKIRLKINQWYFIKTCVARKTGAQPQYGNTVPMALVGTDPTVETKYPYYSSMYFRNIGSYPGVDGTVFFKIFDRIDYGNGNIVWEDIEDDSPAITAIRTATERVPGVYLPSYWRPVAMNLDSNAPAIPPAKGTTRAYGLVYVDVLSGKFMFHPDEAPVVDDEGTTVLVTYCADNTVTGRLDTESVLHIIDPEGQHRVVTLRSYLDSLTTRVTNVENNGGGGGGGGGSTVKLMQHRGPWARLQYDATDTKKATFLNEDIPGYGEDTGVFVCTLPVHPSTVPGRPSRYLMEHVHPISRLFMEDGFTNNYSQVIAKNITMDFPAHWSHNIPTRSSVLTNWDEATQIVFPTVTTLLHPEVGATLNLTRVGVRIASDNSIFADLGLNGDSDDWDKIYFVIHDNNNASRIGTMANPGTFETWHGNVCTITKEQVKYIYTALDEDYKWIYFDTMAALTVGGAYHAHIAIIYSGSVPRTPMIFTVQNLATTPMLKSYYRPSSGVYGTEDYANFIHDDDENSNFFPATEYADDVVDPITNVPACEDGTFRFMPANLATDHSTWDNFSYENYLGVDMVLGRLKFSRTPSEELKKTLYAEFNSRWSTDLISTKGFPTGTNETVSDFDYEERRIGNFDRLNVISDAAGRATRTAERTYLLDDNYSRRIVDDTNVTISLSSCSSAGVFTTLPGEQKLNDTFGEYEIDIPTAISDPVASVLTAEEAVIADGTIYNGAYAFGFRSRTEMDYIVDDDGPTQTFAKTEQGLGLAYYYGPYGLGERMDIFPYNAIEVISDTVDDDLLHGNIARIVVDGNNISDGFTPIAKDLTNAYGSPDDGEVWIDPATRTFIFPRPSYWSTLGRIVDTRNNDIILPIIRDVEKPEITFGFAASLPIKDDGTDVGFRYSSQVVCGGGHNVLQTGPNKDEIPRPITIAPFGTDAYNGDATISLNMMLDEAASTPTVTITIGLESFVFTRLNPTTCQVTTRSVTTTFANNADTWFKIFIYVTQIPTGANTHYFRVYVNGATPAVYTSDSIVGQAVTSQPLTITADAIGVDYGVRLYNLKIWKSLVGILLGGGSGPAAWINTAEAAGNIDALHPIYHAPTYNPLDTVMVKYAGQSEKKTFASIIYDPIIENSGNTALFGFKIKEVGHGWDYLIATVHDSLGNNTALPVQKAYADVKSGWVLFDMPWTTELYGTEGIHVHLHISLPTPPVPYAAPTVIGGNGDDSLLYVRYFTKAIGSTYGDYLTLYDDTKNRIVPDYPAVDERNLDNVNSSMFTVDAENFFATYKQGGSPSYGPFNIGVVKDGYVYTFVLVSDVTCVVNPPTNTIYSHKLFLRCADAYDLSIIYEHEIPAEVSSYLWTGGATVYEDWAGVTVESFALLSYWPQLSSGVGVFGQYTSMPGTNPISVKVYAVVVNLTPTEGDVGAYTIPLNNDTAISIAATRTASSVNDITYSSKPADKYFVASWSPEITFGLGGETYYSMIDAPDDASWTERYVALASDIPAAIQALIPTAASGSPIAYSNTPYCGLYYAVFNNASVVEFLFGLATDSTDLFNNYTFAVDVFESDGITPKILFSVENMNNDLYNLLFGGTNGIFSNDGTEITMGMHGVKDGMGGLCSLMMGMFSPGDVSASGSNMAYNNAAIATVVKNIDGIHSDSITFGEAVIPAIFSSDENFNRFCQHIRNDFLGVGSLIDATLSIDWAKLDMPWYNNRHGVMLISATMIGDLFKDSIVFGTSLEDGTRISNKVYAGIYDLANDEFLGPKMIRTDGVLTPGFIEIIGASSLMNNEPQTLLAGFDCTKYKLTLNEGDEGLVTSNLFFDFGFTPFDNGKDLSTRLTAIGADLSEDKNPRDQYVMIDPKLKEVVLPTTLNDLDYIRFDATMYENGSAQIDDYSIMSSLNGRTIGGLLEEINENLIPTELDPLVMLVGSVYYPTIDDAILALNDIDGNRVVKIELPWGNSTCNTKLWKNKRSWDKTVFVGPSVEHNGLTAPLNITKSFVLESINVITGDIQITCPGGEVVHTQFFVGQIIDLTNIEDDGNTNSSWHQLKLCKVTAIDYVPASFTPPATLVKEQVTLTVRIENSDGILDLDDDVPGSSTTAETAYAYKATMTLTEDMIISGDQVGFMIGNGLFIDGTIILDNGAIVANDLSSAKYIKNLMGLKENFDDNIQTVTIKRGLAVVGGAQVNNGSELRLLGEQAYNTLGYRVPSGCVFGNLVVNDSKASVNMVIGQVQANRSTIKIGCQGAGVNILGAWAENDADGNTIVYNVYDVVTNEGNPYVCIAMASGSEEPHEDTDNTYWMLESLMNLDNTLVNDGHNGCIIGSNLNGVNAIVVADNMSNVEIHGGLNTDAVAWAVGDGIIAKNGSSVIVYGTISDSHTPPMSPVIVSQGAKVEVIALKSAATYYKNVKVVDSAYQITLTDDIIILNGATCDFTLPPVASCTGHMFTIKNIYTGATLTVKGNAYIDSTDGGTGITLARWAYVTLMSTGTIWYKV